ncbi:sulfurtransferase [Leptospira selangorensis]|uniref:Sulfurtransferase n=1 Tax=Leptospira selangorensis TaxID=2484982 RepID=A0A5F2C1M0_9LEPT|nr:sulfurtransferase [Leptospira selangorensis]TGM11501.1 sulfurtransferase [Leptospira selangorensis]TGM21150.1 sulfurtransferase [Leptospira selangorensis]
MIVSSDWLFRRLGDPNIRIVDIRGRVEHTEPRYHSEPELYAKSHIPGSVFIDWTKDIVDLNDPVPVNIAPPEKFSELMAILGISNDTTVVAYDDHNRMFSGRLAWALRYYGNNKGLVLDGGFTGWVKEGKPIDSIFPKYEKKNFIAIPHPELKRNADEVQFRSSNTLLLDGRRPEVYAKGFIPGAINIPHTSLTDPETGKFLSKEELKVSFKNAGVDIDSLPEKIICYCNGGVSATVVVTALGILGIENIPVYDGSWNEWGKDEKRPKVQLPNFGS